MGLCRECRYKDDCPPVSSHQVKVMWKKEGVKANDCDSNLINSCDVQKPWPSQLESKPQKADVPSAPLTIPNLLGMTTPKWKCSDSKPIKRWLHRCVDARGEGAFLFYKFSWSFLGGVLLLCLLFRWLPLSLAASWIAIFMKLAACLGMRLPILWPYMKFVVVINIKEEQHEGTGRCGMKWSKAEEG